MTNATTAVKENEAQTAMELAMNELTEAAIEQPKPKAKKAKAKKPAAKKTKEETPEVEEKPEPVTYKGYELAEGVSPDDIAKMEAKTNEALSNIGNKDAALLDDYMNLGEFLHGVGNMFKSTKLAGQYRKAELPESENLDPALRSNCKWVWEAINIEGHEGADLLNTLGVNRLEDYKSKNPTVIKRAFKAAEKNKAASEKAKELGIEVEDPEELAKEVAKAEKAEQMAAMNEQLEEALKHFGNTIMQNKTKQAIADEAVDIVRELFTRNKKDAIEFLDSL